MSGTRMAGLVKLWFRSAITLTTVVWSIGGVPAVPATARSSSVCRPSSIPLKVVAGKDAKFSLPGAQYGINCWLTIELSPKVEWSGNAIGSRLLEVNINGYGAAKIRFDGHGDHVMALSGALIRGDGWTRLRPGSSFHFENYAQARSPVEGSNVLTTRTFDEAPSNLSISLLSATIGVTDIHPTELEFDRNLTPVVLKKGAFETVSVRLMRRGGRQDAATVVKITQVAGPAAKIRPSQVRLTSVGSGKIVSFSIKASKAGDLAFRVSVDRLNHPQRPLFVEVRDVSGLSRFNIPVLTILGFILLALAAFFRSRGHPEDS